MSGTIAAVAVIGCTAALSMGLAAVGAAGVVAQRSAGAADAAALAAADAAAGAVSGIPCERAAQLAEASGATLAACSLDGLVATVSVRVPFGALAAVASARAGPPEQAPPP